ncbi:hypothetical protein N8766_01945 [bacterium]|nr:hypothetical protein [Verrucomicrobiota bacterium]MDA7632848.1 hypothetical protein [bacterium]
MKLNSDDGPISSPSNSVHGGQQRKLIVTTKREEDQSVRKLEKIRRSHIILKTIYRFEGGTAVLVIARHRPESGRNLKMPVEALDGEVQLISSIPHLGTTSRQPFGPPRQTDRDHTA